MTPAVEIYPELQQAYLNLILRGVVSADWCAEAPLDPIQLERHIRQSAQDSSHIIYTKHARQRMRQRLVNDPMVLEVLRLGSLATPLEPDMKHPGLLCRKD